MSDRISAAEARRLREAATPGPWEAHTDHQGPKVWPTHGAGVDCYIADCDPLHAEGNAALIAAAPTLAATVEALEAERDDLHARLTVECSRRLSVAKDRDEARAAALRAGEPKP